MIISKAGRNGHFPVALPLFATFQVPRSITRYFFEKYRYRYRRYFCKKSFGIGIRYFGIAIPTALFRDFDSGSAIVMGAAV